jgi:GMP synthase (glutamine-hydrolysing)
MPKTAVAIRHVAFEDLGAFAPVLAEHGYAVRYHDVGLDSVAALDPSADDLLVVLGGPIGAYEEDRYPFLREELVLLEARLAADRPTLGICLGAQLMARALGARVVPGPAKEIGFAPLTLIDAGHRSCVGVFEGAPVLHWHGDIFALPEGATRLASTLACDNQAFARGPHAIGFQFHPEAGALGFERWLIGHTVELGAAGIDVAALRAEHDALATRLQECAVACLTHWLALQEPGRR